jgi:hypothetical protein
MAKYEVTLECFECENTGQERYTCSISGNPNEATIIGYDCPECDGRGEIARKVSMYENTQELLEDYPTALNVRLVA